MENIFSKLTRWERVHLARHPKRPFSLDYIKYFSNNFIELHGDRHFGDDPAVIAGIGSFGLESVSRGAKKSFFVENNTEALKNLKKISIYLNLRTMLKYILKMF